MTEPLYAPASEEWDAFVHTPCWKWLESWATHEWCDLGASHQTVPFDLGRDESKMLREFSAILAKRVAVKRLLAQPYGLAKSKPPAKDEWR